jgi:chromosome segregation ATPase
MNRSIWLLIAISILLLSGCASVSTDPREGGLAGGVKGLSTGAYDARIQEREDRLAVLRQVQGELVTEQDQLESTKAQRQRQVAAERTRVRRMNRDIAALNQRVNSLSASANRNDQRVQTLRTRTPQIQRDSARLQSDLDALEGSGLGDSEADLRRAQLEQQRASLQREYELLNQMSLDLAQ